MVFDVCGSFGCRVVLSECILVARSVLVDVRFAAFADLFVYLLFGRFLEQVFEAVCRRGWLTSAVFHLSSPFPLYTSFAYDALCVFV